MTKRIFRAVFITSAAVFLVTMLMILDVLYNYFTDVQRSQLRAETAMTAAAAEYSGAGFLDALAPEEYRVTLIAADGTVLFDSISDSMTMENHLEREEIKEALADGNGESERYSTTLMEHSLYCAQRLSDGTVLRLSISQNSALYLVIGMQQPILFIVLIAGILSFVLANGLSKRIVEPMSRLDLDEPLENTGYPELSPMLRRISQQQAEIRRRTDSLARKQEELDAIIGNMNEGMLLTDRDGRIIAANHAAETMLGVPRLREGDVLFGSCSGRELIQAFDAASHGTPVQIRAELSHIIVQINAAPVRSGEEIAGTAIVLFDITEREQAEQQRREFTANVSHELKTPLQVISGYSEIMKNGIAAPEDVPKFAGSIFGEAQRMTALVEDIINLSHLDEGGVDLHWETVDLFAQAREVCDSLSELAAQNGVTLSLEGEPSEIRGVEELVQSILFNICDNAVKYNRAGGRVDVTVKDRTVTVADTGIGIRKEHIDRIFERFYRVDKSHSKEVGGTGLGLSIVKHAALIHNAHIDVNSEPGKGTCVTVTFPEKA